MPDESSCIAESFVFIYKHTIRKYIIQYVALHPMLIQFTMYKIYFLSIL